MISLNVLGGLGALTPDKINQTIASAIQEAADAAGGFEKLTAQDLQTRITQVIAVALDAEKQAIQPILERIDAFNQQFSRLNTNIETVLAGGIQLTFGAPKLS